MKRLNPVVTILLNVTFCTMFLWFYIRNSVLRPFTGSYLKESASGLLLLGSLYINYFLFYPKIYLKYSRTIYWVALVALALVTGLLDLAFAYRNIVSCNAQVIQIVGPVSFFSHIFFLIFVRNLAVNLFPFLFRDRQHFKKSLEKETKVVYQTVQMLDVTDKESNILLVKIEDILYCRQQRNFTEIFVVQHKKYTRLGSMKHLEQLLGDDFIRISATELVSFRHIESCNEDTVIMKKMPWEEAPITFKLEYEVAEKATKGIMNYKIAARRKKSYKKPGRPKGRRKPITPSDEKVKEVLSYIEKHSDCNTGDIIAGTKISLSTIERCISELKKQGLIEHTGSKKTGGYQVVNKQTEEKGEGEKVDRKE